MDKTLERVGNWYKINDNGKLYYVLVQKEDDHTVLCDPSSIVILDCDTYQIIEDDKELYERVQEVMENVDWEYDTID